MLVGCSGDDAETADGAEEAVHDVLDAIDDGDYDDACDGWTEEYQKQSIDDWNKDMDPDSTVRSCESMLRQAMMLAKAFDDEFDLSIDKTTSEETDAGFDVTVVFNNGDESLYQMVYDDGDWLVANEVDGPGEAEGTDESGEEETPTETPLEPSALNTPASVGEWTITVTEVEKDATKTIKKANPYNEPAQEQYLLVTYTATYNGTERTADASSDLSWSLTGTDSVVLDPASQVTPNENQNVPTQVRTGGTVEVQVLFDADPSVVAGGLVTVETWTDSGDESYVDFQL